MKGQKNQENDYIKELLPIYRHLTAEHFQRIESITDPNELRVAEVAYQKEQMRAAFLSNELATDEDFERLWPSLLDEQLRQHAQGVFMQVTDSIIKEGIKK
jgi:hypothetical protein